MESYWILLLSWGLLFFAMFFSFMLFHKLENYYEAIMSHSSYDDCKAVRILTLHEVSMLSEKDLKKVSIYYHALMVAKHALMRQTWYTDDLSPKQKVFCYKEIKAAERAWARCRLQIGNRVEGLFDVDQLISNDEVRDAADKAIEEIRRDMDDTS